MRGHCIIVVTFLCFRLYGYKWFSSATDSDMSMTLAKVEDEGGDTSDKLSMFYLETRDDQGQLNNIQVKQKTLNDVQVFRCVYWKYWMTHVSR